MKTVKNIIKSLLVVLIVIYVISACIPIIHTRTCVFFRNYTKDTLFVGASLYDNIDSVNSMLFPNYARYDDLDTIIVFQHKYLNVHPTDFVLPDSLCRGEPNYLFNEHDTCYFFLVKWKDAKNYSFDEIRKKKLYHRWIVTRDKKGKFNTDIRY